MLCPRSTWHWLKLLYFANQTCYGNKWNLHQSTFLSESQKALKVHRCKSWITNLLIVPHTLGTLTANITYCVILLEHINESSECMHSVHVALLLSPDIFVVWLCHCRLFFFSVFLCRGRSSSPFLSSSSPIPCRTFKRAHGWDPTYRGTSLETSSRVGRMGRSWFGPNPASTSSRSTRQTLSTRTPSTLCECIFFSSWCVRCHGYGYRGPV